MTIQEFYKQQKELRNSLIPDNIQWILDMHKQHRAAVEMIALTPFNSQSVADSLAKPFISWDSCAAAFRAIDSLGSLSIINPLRADINDYWIREYDLENFSEEDPETDEVVILVDETSRIKKIITDIYYDNSVLHIIEPRQFEEIVAEILYSKGFEVELTKQTRDKGFDIIALKYIDGFVPLKFLVECKRYTREKVGVEIIRSFKEVLATENANRGIIVTTSYFSKEATKKKDNSPYLLDYKDKDNVIEWVQEYYKQKIRY